MCGFVPLREGIADDPRRPIPLTADDAVTLHLNQEHTVDPARLAGVLDHPRTEVWTGVTVGAGQSLEWLFLWLACIEAGRLCRLGVEPGAVESGLVDPMFASSAVAVVGEGELAYLTWRAADGACDRRERAEVGVIGHSAAGAGLTDRVAAAIRLWDATKRQQSVRFEIPAHRIDRTDARSGRFFLDRPHNPITVIWQ